MTLRLWRLLRLRVRNQFLDYLGAWWFVVTLVVNQAVAPLTGLVVWSTVLPGNPAIADYFVALVAVQLLTASFENHTFSETVYDGRISHDLLKPQPIIVGPAGENIGLRLWLAVFGLPLTVLAAVAAGASYSIRAAVAAVPLVLAAAVLRFLWTWLLALTAFWTERVHAVVAFGTIVIFLLGGAAAPISELPDPWQALARALPFYAMLGLPAETAAGIVHGPAVGIGLLYQVAWCLVFGCAAVAAWRHGLRRYTAVGA